jgi:CheY-like chemotaxis protein
MNATLDRNDCSILITDDDVECRESLREIVELQGFHALLAGSGEEAIDLVRSAAVHLALFDMNLPTMTGLEVLQVVRQFNAQLPVILVTGDASETVVRQAYSQQVYSVIPKPISKNVVLYTMLRALSRFYGIMTGAQESRTKQEPKKADAAPIPPRESRRPKDANS